MIQLSEFFVLIEQSEVAAYFRGARWGYAVLSACHILGIALLVGSTVPLSLRLLGLWPMANRAELARVLVPMAITGLVVSIATGFVLFSTRATEYAALSIFWVKIGLISVATLSAAIAHTRHGFWFQRTNRPVLVEVAAVSLLSWIAVLFAGRLIAFAG